MPYKPNVPCKHPGCNQLVPYGQRYCDEHKPLHKEDRPSSDKRGYNSRWRKARAAFLKENPLCVYCLQKEPKEYVVATVVDHIKPHRGDQRLFWDKNNWQPLCKKCHDKKTWRYERLPEYHF